MAWRAMNSLLVLRDQVNAIAPGRSKASDGLVGDEDHQVNNPGSGHNPHYVAGVGDEIVTAWDCTHDPGDGCDCGELTETLRTNRDKRIRYVIFNRRIFSSYAVTENGIHYDAWEWRPYYGSDPHTGHAHIQTLDDPIADTSTPWNLDGFGDDMTPAQGYILERILNYRLDAIRGMKTDYTIPEYDNAGNHWNPRTETNELAVAINDIKARLTALETGGGSGSDGSGGGLTPDQATDLEDIKRDTDLITAGLTALGEVFTAPPAA